MSLLTASSAAIFHSSTLGTWDFLDLKNQKKRVLALQVVSAVALIAMSYFSARFCFTTAYPLSQLGVVLLAKGIQFALQKGEKRFDLETLKNREKIALPRVRIVASIIKFSVLSYFIGPKESYTLIGALEIDFIARSILSMNLFQLSKDKALVSREERGYSVAESIPIAIISSLLVFPFAQTVFISSRILLGAMCVSFLTSNLFDYLVRDTHHSDSTHLNSENRLIRVL